MTRYLLDTTFVIDWLRGEQAAVGRMQRIFGDGDEPHMNEVVLCELATGASADGRSLTAIAHAVEYVQPAPEAAIWAGRQRGELRRRGLTVSVPDALIAAAAHALNATLLTRNVRDFRALPIKVEAY